MNLDKAKDLFNNIKENKFVQNFMEELADYLENSDRNAKMSNDFHSQSNQLISKYKNKALMERQEILQNYADRTKEEGEMYYIYDKSANQKGAYNLCNCSKEKSHEVITRKVEDLPESVALGSVLRKKGQSFIIDVQATEAVAKEINDMIHEKLEEQNEYLASKRVEGHVYEVGEKDSEAVWLYDVTNNNRKGNRRN